MADSPWPVIEKERLALADDLESLPEEKFDTQTLCHKWNVLELLGHINETAAMTPPKFFLRFAAAGFSFGRFEDKRVAEAVVAGPKGSVQRLRKQASWTKSPPGPVDSWLGETIIHAEDIRRPLGIAHDYPTDAVVRVADFYKKSNLIVGAKKRIAGLKLRATDAAWQTGEGPEAAGPILDLVLAMTGRASGAANLTGDGAATLASRCT